MGGAAAEKKHLVSLLLTSSSTHCKLVSKATRLTPFEPFSAPIAPHSNLVRSSFARLSFVHYTEAEHTDSGLQ